MTKFNFTESLIASCGAIIILTGCVKEQTDACAVLSENKEYHGAAEACRAQFMQTKDLTILDKWIEALAAQNEQSTIKSLLEGAVGKPYHADALFYAARAIQAYGDNPKSIEYYERSADLFADNNQYRKQAYAFHQLFTIQWYKSNHRAALSYAKNSLTAAQQANDKQSEITALNDLFIIFEEVGSFGPAQQALSLINEKLGENAPARNRIGLSVSQGMLNMTKRRFGLAEDNFQQALIAASGSNNRAGLRGLHLNLVHANIMLGRLEIASEHLKIAWDYANADGSIQYALLFYQSLLNYHKGKYSIAYEDIQLALASKDLPEVWAWEMHYWAGETAHEMGNPSLAIASYEMSIKASESLRKNLGADKLKAHLLSRKRDAYEALFLELMDNGKTMEAFAISEQAKTRSFIDAYVRATEEGAGSEEIDIAFNTVSDRIENLHTYLNTMNNSDIVNEQNIDDVVIALGKRTLLSYFKAKNRMFVVKVANSKVVIKELPLVHASFTELVHAYEENLNDSVTLEKLGIGLFPPGLLPNDSGHLFIAPDDFVGRVALATVRINDKYLVENHSVSLIPSAGSLVKILEVNQTARRGKQYIVMGDPSNDLPAAKEEVSRISKKLGVKELVGSEAKFADLLLKRSPDILHIASHSGTSYLGPWIRFADADISGDTIVSERIRPRLAVLASCASGVGQDGYFWGSLGGLFLSSGTPSTIVSLWSVEDKNTLSIMMKYYTEYLAGQSVAGSLAAVQREAIKEGIEPQEWGSFTVLGLP